jgi:hypothetical protein
MMSDKRMVVWVLAALIGWAGCATAAVGPPRTKAPLPDAKEIIKRSLKATYGKDGVPSKKHWHRKLTGGVSTTRGHATAESEVWESAGGSYREKTCLNDRSESWTRLFVKTPTEAWEQVRETKLTGKKTHGPSMIRFPLQPLLDDKETKLTVLGEGKVSIPWVFAQKRYPLLLQLVVKPIKAIAVRATKSGNPEFILHFNKKTWLLVMVHIRDTFLWVPTRNESLYFFDYKTVEGEKMPMGYLRLTPEGFTSLKVTECRAVDRIDEKLFRKPW